MSLSMIHVLQQVYTLWLVLVPGSAWCWVTILQTFFYMFDDGQTMAFLDIWWHHSEFLSTFISISSWRWNAKGIKWKNSSKNVSRIVEAYNCMKRYSKLQVRLIHFYTFTNTFSTIVKVSHFGKSGYDHYYHQCN